MTADAASYDHANSAKAKFEDIYNAPDPRAYYTTLQQLGYEIPTNAKPVFRKVIDHMKSKRPLNVLDVGCSYGVNAAMLKYDLTFDELAARYASENMQMMSVAETVVMDAQTFVETPIAAEVEFFGLDVAEEAAGYADAVGLIEAAVVENLEAAPLSDTGVETLRDIDLIISTGAVGYVGAETFSKLLDATEGEKPWIAVFVLRQFPFAPIEAKLEDYGYVTERLPDVVFRQRRFRDAEEHEGAIEAVRAAGRDPEGLETEGSFYAEFYLSRPRSQLNASVVDLGLV
ncbi:MAG: class I SAM-dependent methyltransferase [Hyphococcus sp.]